MARRWKGDEALPEPMMTYCRLDHQGQTSVKFASKYTNIQPRRCIWKCRLSCVGHFVHSMCLLVVTMPLDQSRLHDPPTVTHARDFVTGIHFTMTFHLQYSLSYFAVIWLAPGQWETPLQSNAVSHWLGAIPGKHIAAIFCHVIKQSTWHTYN